MSAVSGRETEQAVAGAGVKPPLAVPRRLLRMRSDAALVERFAAGDEAAFDVLYERHRPVVLAVCMGVLGTPQDAEDATQETFSALAVAMRTRPPAELRPWLIRVARNASIDTTRRRRHRLLTLDGEIPEVAARPTGSGKAELAVVLDGIRELPEGQRMALLMRELGGHSYMEIADFLETDEEAVKGLIARARVGLRTYREATELSCATARTAIAAEPDGRRYDKTIRRHLHNCASCRSYRAALRDDAKALRAALPLQAGSVATGSLGTGMLTAAKGSMLGYGLTQAAATCAASACAVGAIGGMVFVAPVNKVGLPPILAPIKAAPVHRHSAVVRPAAGHTLAASSHGSGAAPQVARSAPSAATPARPAAGPKRTVAVDRHHHHAPSVTIVKLPKLPAPPSRSATPAPPATPPAVATPPAPTSSQAPPAGAGATAATTSGVPTQPGQGGQGQGAGAQSGTAGGQSGTSGGGHWGSTSGGSWHTGGSSSGNPIHSVVVQSGTPTASTPPPPAPPWNQTSTTATQSTPTTVTPAATTTTAQWGHGSGQTQGWGHGQPGSQHGVWNQGATAGGPTASAPATPAITATTTTPSDTTSSGQPAGWGGRSGWAGWGSSGWGSGHSRWGH